MSRFDLKNDTLPKNWQLALEEWWLGGITFLLVGKAYVHLLQYGSVKGGHYKLLKNNHLHTGQTTNQIFIRLLKTKQASDGNYTIRSLKGPNGNKTAPWVIQLPIIIKIYHKNPPNVSKHTKHGSVCAILIRIVIPQKKNHRNLPKYRNCQTLAL